MVRRKPAAFERHQSGLREEILAGRVEAPGCRDRFRSRCIDWCTAARRHY